MDSLCAKLLLVIALASTSVSWGFPRCAFWNYQGDQLGSLALQAGEKTTAKTQFIERGSGELTDESGVDFVFTRFEVRSGPTLLFITRTFASASAANTQFEKAMKNASQVQVREIKKNSGGTIVGERGVASVRSEKGTDEVHAVIWTSGSKYSEIRCASLRYALEFEKKYDN